MAGFAQNLLRDAVNAFFGSDYVRDYSHASKVFRPNGYAYSPKLKFLFHVYFEINQNAYAVGLSTGANFGLAVKNIKLPSYTFTTHELNQYNRKRIVQTKVKYDPIDITFHDDNNNLIRNLWFNYYSYYYADTNKPVLSYNGNQTDFIPIDATPGNANYNRRNIYDNDIAGDEDWGYIGETSSSPPTASQVGQGASKVPFFKNITVYGFNQHKFSAYSLINPIITRFSHDTYDYSAGEGIMQNTMTIDYETVKYFEGAISGNNPSNVVPGFGMTESYDKRLSPIAVPGSQATFLGQGGLVDAAGGFIQNISNGNYLGAIQTAGTAYNTFKNVNLKQTAISEINTALLNSTQNTPNRNVNFQFPVFGQTTSSGGQAGQPNGALNGPPPTINVSGVNISTGGL